MAYSELATLDFAGELIRTERSKYALGKVTLSARQGILEEPLTAAARCLGNLSGRGDVLEAYIFVPVERMSELVLVAQAGRIQFISFVASKLRYGSGAVYGVALHSEADEEWQ
ncbi:hypothetical protein ACFB49_46950 [Sphingomonas sp. DBB INV C78]|uniref:hypothetical protein n=1 Tax=Sphingomonas sp. DBB INV C78 TaxID=3349434 RepID=UPI0036D34A5C